MIPLLIGMPLRRALSFAFLLKHTCHQGSPRRIGSFQASIGGLSQTDIGRYATTNTALHAIISQQDVEYMQLAISHAKIGLGHTFPNPAVGCVLVNSDSNQVVGAGFHPRAGFPHAEVFALLQAMGHVPDGVQAAQVVGEATAANNNKKNREKNNGKDQQDNMELFTKVQKLTDQYASPNGPEALFAENNAFQDIPVTAYVTLEPCCHYGKTPPCAASLVQSKVSRVVVGFRDPNPRVDGGGVQLLQEANIAVDMMSEGDTDEAQQTHQACRDLVTDFCKRITPRTLDYSSINGAMRRALRSHAGRQKANNTLCELEWTGASVRADSQDLKESIHDLTICPSWLEEADHRLWEHELINLRLGKAIKKKKGAGLLGERIAEQLQAHVAQTVGHTVLLYRPGIPPVLDLPSLGKEDNADDNDDN